MSTVCETCHREIHSILDGIKSHCEDFANAETLCEFLWMPGSWRLIEATVSLASEQRMFGYSVGKKSSTS
jgi:hypothetical protein